jgi:hypothetical protein
MYFHSFKNPGLVVDIVEGENRCCPPGRSGLIEPPRSHMHVERRSSLSTLGPCLGSDEDCDESSLPPRNSVTFRFAKKRLQNFEQALIWPYQLLVMGLDHHSFQGIFGATSGVIVDLLWA